MLYIILRPVNLQCLYNITYTLLWLLIAALIYNIGTYVSDIGSIGVRNNIKYIINRRRSIDRSYLPGVSSFFYSVNEPLRRRSKRTADKWVSATTYTYTYVTLYQYLRMDTINCFSPHWLRSPSQINEYPNLYKVYVPIIINIVINIIFQPIYIYIYGYNERK